MNVSERSIDVLGNLPASNLDRVQIRNGVRSGGQFDRKEKVAILLKLFSFRSPLIRTRDVYNRSGNRQGSGQERRKHEIGSQKGSDCGEGRN